MGQVGILVLKVPLPEASKSVDGLMWASMFVLPSYDVSNFKVRHPHDSILQFY